MDTPMVGRQMGYSVTSARARRATCAWPRAIKPSLITRLMGRTFFFSRRWVRGGYVFAAFWVAPDTRYSKPPIGTASQETRLYSHSWPGAAKAAKAATVANSKYRRNCP